MKRKVMKILSIIVLVLFSGCNRTIYGLNDYSDEFLNMTEYCKDVGYENYIFDEKRIYSWCVDKHYKTYTIYDSQLSTWYEIKYDKDLRKDYYAFCSKSEKC